MVINILKIHALEFAIAVEHKVVIVKQVIEFSIEVIDFSFLVLVKVVIMNYMLN